MKKKSKNLTGLKILFIVFLLAQHKTVLSQWQLKLAKDSIFVYNKPVINKIYSFRAETIFSVPSDSLYHFFLDFSSYPNWIDFCESASCFRAIADSIYSVYFFFDMPWPVLNRDAIVDFYVNNDLQSNSIFVTSAKSDLKYKRPLGTIRFTNFNISYKIQPVQKNKTRFIIQGSFRPDGFCPPFLVEKMLKWGPYDTLKRIKKTFE